MDIYFSDYFKVSPDTIDKYGAFNVSLVADLPLFIDPFLLFNSRKPEYRALHDRIITYLRFLRDQAADRDLDPGLLKAWYRFSEIKQNWLGFSVDGNRGSGLGRILRGLEGERLGGLHSRPPIVPGWFFQAACFAVTLWAMDV